MTCGVAHCAVLDEQHWELKGNMSTRNYCTYCRLGTGCFKTAVEMTLRRVTKGTVERSEPGQPWGREGVTHGAGMVLGEGSDVGQGDPGRWQPQVVLGGFTSSPAVDPGLRQAA